MKAIALCLSLWVVPAAEVLAGEVKVEIKAGDNMQYSTKMIEATVGDTIVLKLINMGKLPKDTMAHNLVVLKPGTSVPVFAQKCVSEKANDYITTHSDFAPLVVAHTKLLGPGESQVLRFQVTAAGSYPFMCTFPGHFGVMSGTLRVK